MDDPYQIATAADLIGLGNCPDDYDKHFVLTTDIDLDPHLPGRQVFDGAVIGCLPTESSQASQGTEGYQGTPFTGVLDGNDHEIRNVVIEAPWSNNPYSRCRYVGLIAQIGENGQVKRLGLRDISIDAYTFVGALAGENKGTILSCYSSGRVTGYDLVGGLVGGHYTGTIASSHSAGNVKGTRVGGLVGLLWTGTVSSCYSTASVVKHGQISDMIGYFEYAGGLVGRNWETIISCCYASGDVTGDVLAGGLVGTNNNGTIYSCYSSSKITGDAYAGGLAGANSGNIISSYSTGNVSGKFIVGGLVGVEAGSIATSYSVGKVTGSSYTGGLVGECRSTSLFLSYWDLETSGLKNSAVGEGKITQQMMSLATFTGWGHDAQWTLEEGKSYPHLVWEGRPGVPLADPPRTYSGGTGDTNDPYLVQTAEDLACLGRFPADWGAAFALVGDINLDRIGPNQLLPVGTRGLPFTGTFDGCGHTVRDLGVASMWGSYLGLFGRVGPSGAVRHLHLTNVDISGRDYAAGLVGSNDGSILACSVTGRVAASKTAGGLAGQNGGTVASSRATCIVSGRAVGDIGGLVGENHGTVSSCYAMGTAEGFYVGGLVGDNQLGVVTTCYSTVAVEGGIDYTGGLVGRVNGEYGYGTVTTSFWDIETSGYSEASEGTGVPTREMQKGATFLDAGWDFVGETANGTEDIWWILEGKDYPHLWWEAAEK